MQLQESTVLVMVSSKQLYVLTGSLIDDQHRSTFDWNKQRNQTYKP